MTYVHAIPKPKKADKRWRSQAHRKWVSGHYCIVEGCRSMPIECAHVRLGLPAGEQAGMGFKPGDMWTVALCQEHHREQHAMGEASFAAKHNLNLVAAAQEFFRASPHRHKAKLLERRMG